MNALIGADRTGFSSIVRTHSALCRFFPSLRTFPATNSQGFSGKVDNRYRDNQRSGNVGIGAPALPYERWDDRSNATLKKAVLVRLITSTGNRASPRNNARAGRRPPIRTHDGSHDPEGVSSKGTRTNIITQNRDAPPGTSRPAGMSDVPSRRKKNECYSNRQ